MACWAGTSDVTFRRLDIADPASVDEFGKWAEQDLQTVDILVNNAGMLLGTSTEHLKSSP